MRRAILVGVWRTMAMMTEQPPNRPSQPASPPSPPDLGDRVQQHAEAFGREAQARGEQLGREAQAAADRWTRDRRVTSTVNTAGRVWGLILVFAGLWFLADVTFGYQLPTIPWRDVWPAALILLGLFVIARGMTRRT